MTATKSSRFRRTITVRAIQIPSCKLECSVYRTTPSFSVSSIADSNSNPDVTVTFDVKKSNEKNESATETETFTTTETPTPTCTTETPTTTTETETTFTTTETPPTTTETETLTTTTETTFTTTETPTTTTPTTETETFTTTETFTNTTEKKFTKHVFVCLHAHPSLNATKEMMLAYCLKLCSFSSDVDKDCSEHEKDDDEYDSVVYNCSFNESSSSATEYWSSSNEYDGEREVSKVLELVRYARREEKETQKAVDSTTRVIKVHLIGYSFGASIGASCLALQTEECSIDSLVAIAFPLGGANPFATSFAGLFARFLLWKHSERIRNYFKSDDGDDDDGAHKARVVFIHGENDEFTRAESIKKFSEELARLKPTDARDSGFSEEDAADAADDISLNAFARLFFRGEESVLKKNARSGIDRAVLVRSLAQKVAYYQIDGLTKDSANHLSLCRDRREIDLVIDAIAVFLNL